MKRYYGVIKDEDTAKKFVNDLYAATSKDDFSPIKIMSYYDLTEKARAAQQKALDRLYSIGFVNTIIDSETQEMLIRIASKNTFGLTEDSVDQTAVLADNLAIIVHPPTGGSDASIEEYDANIIIKHTVTKSDDTKVTSTTYLRTLNDNTAARGVAYEITSTESGDALVKIASCLPDISVDSKAFVGLSINAYESGDTALPIVSLSNHSALNFGTKGSYGGFALHRMKDGDDVFGITVFRRDGSPLFTWTPDGESLLDTNESGQLININSPMGRNLGDVFDEDGQPVIQMAALAPIFCPASTNISRTAKWMQQSPHDYSYFDGSGHIQVGRKKNTFFVDHGVCLFDDVPGSTEGTIIPGIRPTNEAISVRPEIPDEMPYSQHLFAYFDSKAGLSSKGWMNYRDENNDMIFSGKPIINSDGSCRFISRASNPVYGRFTGPMYGWDGANDKYGWVIFAVLKVNRSKPTPPDQGYIYPLLGASHPTNTWFDGSSSSPWWFTGLQACYYDSTDTDKIRNGDLIWHATPDSGYTMPADYFNAYTNPGQQTNYVAVCFHYAINNYAWCDVWQHGQRIVHKRGGMRPTANNWVTQSGLKAGVDNANWAIGAYISPTGDPPERNIWARPWEYRWADVYAGTSGAPTDGGEVYVDVKFMAAGMLGYNTNNGRTGYAAYSNEYDSYCVPALRYLCERFDV